MFQKSEAFKLRKSFKSGMKSRSYSHGKDYSKYKQGVFNSFNKNSSPPQAQPTLKINGRQVDLDQHITPRTLLTFLTKINEKLYLFADKKKAALQKTNTLKYFQHYALGRTSKKKQSAKSTPHSQRLEDFRPTKDLQVSASKIQTKQAKKVNSFTQNWTQLKQRAKDFKIVKAAVEHKQRYKEGTEVEPLEFGRKNRWLQKQKKQKKSSGQIEREPSVYFRPFIMQAVQGVRIL